MSTAGLVSVIMPAYNRRDYIREALDSILAQTAGRHEIIVIDDGSTDGTADIVRAYGDPVACHSQPNAGIGAALNHGLRRATGEWLAFLDSDDLWLPGKTAAQFAHADRHPETDLIFGHYEEFVSPEIPAGQLSLGERAVGPRPALLYGALLTRRATFARVGPFDEKLTLGHFIDWQARSRALGLTETVLPETVLRRRIHRSNTTLTRKTDYRDYLKVMKAHLDRRRAATGDR